MEVFGLKCALLKNEILGRYIVANRDIKKGELLLTEKPSVVGPAWNSNICCLGCYSKAQVICKKCLVAPLCSKCQTHNDKECEFYIKHKIDKDFLINNFNVVSPIRFLCAINTDSLNISDHDLLKMEGHESTRKSLPIWKFIENYVIKPLMSVDSMKNLGIDEQFIQKVCGILDVNTFELRIMNQMEMQNQNQLLVRGLYPNAALLSHDCVANTFITLDHENTLKIYAKCPIKKDDIITYNYTKLLSGTEERQRHLQEGKYFTCSCERCKSPTELDTYLSSVKCKECNGMSSLTNGKWVCEKCQKEQGSNRIEGILQKAKDDILNNESVTDLDKLIPKYSKILNKNHWLVIEAKQNFIALLRMREDLKHNMLLKKLDYCEEINEVIQKLEPGISRLRGISLYETFKTLNEICGVEFESEQITEKQLTEKLLRCEQILKESIENLLFEPLKSPESQLMRFAMQELKMLRESNSEV